MPTIEIAIFEADVFEINQDDFEMAIIMDPILESHRALFIDEIEHHVGTILHLGNPEFKGDDGWIWGNKLISTEEKEVVIPVVDPNDPTDNWGANQQYGFQWENAFRQEIDRLLRMGIQHSRINKIGFLTDYQFGPEKGSKRIVYTIEEFWEIHDQEKLVLNTFYEMYRE